jgi:hypothetical protein
MTLNTLTRKLNRTLNRLTPYSDTLNRPTFLDVADARGVDGDPPVGAANNPNGHTIGLAWGTVEGPL